MTTLVLIVIVILVCVFCAGLIAEALRIAPKTPEQLYWAPEIPIRYVDIDGNRIRYIKTGSGPNLVLLHTLGTALTYASGLRPGHYHAFLNLIRHAHHWEEARQRYGKTFRCS